MTNQFEIKKATRRGVIPLVGLYAESGCGKTMSALLLARGLVGPFGDIHMIDTESRRGSLYADVIPGGFSVLDFDSPFTPSRYIAALETVLSAGAKVAVIDSASHEHDGIGGVLDMASENEKSSGRAGLHNWKQPKFEHAKFMQYLLRYPIPVIVCVRAKYKTRQVKDERGKTQIVKDQHTSPIQAEDFIFDLTAHAEVLPDHSINLTKCSHPDLRKCFPEKGPITIQHGELIAKWCAAGGTIAQPASTHAATSPEDKASKKKLWDMTQHIHKGDTTALETFLVHCNLLEPGIALSSVTGGKLKALVAQTEEELSANATK